MQPGCTLAHLAAKPDRLQHPAEMDVRFSAAVLFLTGVARADAPTENPLDTNPERRCAHLSVAAAKAQPWEDASVEYLRCKYRAEEAAKERGAQARTRPPAEIEAIPEAMRTPTENEVLDEVRFRREVASLRGDPSAVVAARSAALCVVQSELDYYEGQLREERRASKIGGVVNLSTVDELQREILHRRDAVAALRLAFKRSKTKPLACESESVAPVVRCMAASQAPVCSARAMRLRVALAEGAL